MIEVAEQSTVNQEWVPAKEEDRELVRAHLEQLLKHPLFSHSKRLSSFLRFVVNESLQGNANAVLKERSIGMMAFGRPADYDTNLDPVVRIAAGEVRKKLAQYYYDNDNSVELRIELPLGTYLPRFRRTQPAIPAAASVAEEPTSQFETPTSAPSLIKEETTSQPKRKIWWLTACVLLLALGWGYVGWRFFYKSDVDRFWSSFTGQSNNVLLVLPAIKSAVELQPGQDPASRNYKFEAESVALEDAAVAAKVSGQLLLRQKQSKLTFASGVSLSDLRSGPAVLIAALDNSWTMRSMKSLPYIFERSEDRRYGRIVDTTDKARRSWTTDFAIPNVKISNDYGVVALYTDPMTEQRVLLLAGISAEGTFAAGEAVTNNEYLKSILSKGAGTAKNFEAVIQTQTVDGNSGPPHIVAFKSW